MSSGTSRIVSCSTRLQAPAASNATKGVLYCTIECPPTRYSRSGHMATSVWIARPVDALQLLGLTLVVPIVILLVGAPVALVIACLLWLARLAGSG